LSSKNGKTELQVTGRKQLIADSSWFIGAGKLGGSEAWRLGGMKAVTLNR
jgi:hypothetical protein